MILIEKREGQPKKTTTVLFRVERLLFLGIIYFFCCWKKDDDENISLKLYCS